MPIFPVEKTELVGALVVVANVPLCRHEVSALNYLGTTLEMDTSFVD